MTFPDITLVLKDIAAGATDRRSELFDLLYSELRGIAGAHLQKERADHTLQATALVNEAWIKLVDQEAVPEGGRSHFLSVASQAMRRILVDHARGKKRDKRGGGAAQIELDQITLRAFDNPADQDDADVDLERLDALMTELAARSPRQSQVIEMRFFGGLTSEEVAEVLGVSLATVNREWKFARVWLLSKL